MSALTDFPAPYRLPSGHLAWDYDEVEDWKRQLMGFEPIERDPNGAIRLLNAKQLEAGLPFGRRTIGRLVAGRVRDNLPTTSRAA